MGWGACCIANMMGHLSLIQPGAVCQHVLLVAKPPLRRNSEHHVLLILSEQTSRHARPRPAVTSNEKPKAVAKASIISAVAAHEGSPCIAKATMTSQFHPEFRYVFRIDFVWIPYGSLTAPRAELCSKNNTKSPKWKLRFSKAARSEFRMAKRSSS